MFDRVRRLVKVAFGEGVLAESDPEDLFAISTGYITLGSNGYESLDTAGLCFGNVDATAFEQAVTDIEDLLAISESATARRQDIYEDDYGYSWVILENTDFEELVTAVHGAADTLIEAGFGDYLLCAVFAFQGPREAYLIYNFKRGTWYPFVPIRDGNRDEGIESELADLLTGELQLETEESREYALWGIPF